MKIYTAATFSEQKRIRQYKEQLIQMGHTITASWLEEQIKPSGMMQEQFDRKMAAKDLQEISSADCIILDLENPSKTSGKMIEFGFALAKHKLSYVVGEIPPGGIFMYLADHIFPNWETLFAYFAEHHKESHIK